MFFKKVLFPIFSAKPHTCNPIELPTENGWYLYDSTRRRFEIPKITARERAIAAWENNQAALAKFTKYEKSFRAKIFNVLINCGFYKYASRKSFSRRIVAALFGPPSPTPVAIYAFKALQNNRSN